MLAINYQITDREPPIRALIKVPLASPSQVGQLYRMDFKMNIKLQADLAIMNQ
jgi:hypothetical protein